MLPMGAGYEDASGSQALPADGWRPKPSSASTPGSLAVTPSSAASSSESGVMIDRHEKCSGGECEPQNGSSAGFTMPSSASQIGLTRLFITASKRQYWTACLTSGLVRISFLPPL